MAKFYGVPEESLIFENWVVEREYFTLIFNFKNMIFMKGDAVRISKLQILNRIICGPLIRGLKISGSSI